jgi:D-cysteine desulfhydrase
MLNEKLNKIKLGNFPTRIVYNKKITDKLNVNFFIKNEFEADVFGGGNKVRKIEYCLRYFKNHGITDIIVDGDLQSNYCMAMANYCIPHGYNVHLVLSGEKSKVLGGNRLQMRLSGAKVYEIGGWNLDKIKKMEAKIKKICEKKGGKVALLDIDLSNSVTLQASIELGKEIFQQEQNLKIKFDYIFIAAGTGETHAGIEIYKQLNNLEWNVIGVSIANKIKYFHNYHKTINTIFKDQIDINKFKIITSFIGGGYGRFIQKDIDNMLYIRKRYGLILDSIYTYKCFKAINKILVDKKIPTKTNVLFVHTGGINQRFFPPYNLC